MQIKHIKIEGFAALAPMAGVADRATREISRSYGAAYTVGEMTSAKGVSMGSEKSFELLEIDESPFAVQLFGADPDSMRTAARVAAEKKPDIIDINMGCPAPKVTGNGGGSALLRDLLLAERIIKATIEGAGDIPVTVKIRKGYDRDDDIAVEAARMIEQAGAAAITVHGRTRAQLYSPPVDIGSIARVKQAVSIPVIGNGDIYTVEDAVRMYEETGCDLVMIGRGALGNPWLFEQINARMQGKPVPEMPPVEERLRVMRREIELLIKYKGEYIGFREARKHTSWYLTGMRGAAQLRKLCGTIETWDDIDAMIAATLERNKPDAL